MKFRKKPVVIEAVKFINDPFSEIEGEEPEWYRAGRTIDPGELGSISYLQLKGSTYGVLIIQTLEGAMRCEPGDWVIRGVKGEIYSCKNDVFEQSYEHAQDHQREP